ncbi:MAG TPA: hypothetical protein VIL48_19355 [Acidimicrobiales bacterium]
MLARDAGGAGGAGSEAAADFVRDLQAALDTFDADAFNRQFARDVLWGSPFGAITRGYDEIHAIHSAMFAAAASAGRPASATRSRTPG